VADGVNEAGEVARATDDRAAERRLLSGLPIGASRRSFRAISSPHASKFRVVTGALAGIAVGALAVAFVIIANHSPRPASQQWSAWSPTDSGRLGATEIAEHVAPFYRISTAQQLDLVTLINLSNPSTTGTTTGSGLEVAVGSSASSSSGTLSLLGGKTIAYNLCGLGGSGCQIGGSPSSTRLLLLRREALELAMYTFKYLGGVQNVICVLPPGRTQATSTLSPTPPPAGPARSSATQPVTIAVLFVRDELSPFLSEPLGTTLAEFPPATSQLTLWKGTQEAGLVDQITARGLFSEKVESAQVGGSLMVLNPLPPQ
jgi:hypothetical protein